MGIAAHAAVPEGQELTRLPSIDGLRGLAVLTVVVFHSFADRFADWWWVLSPGYVGVRLFFVLSGALITSLLLDLRGQPRALRTFWTRRALRIFPLAYFTMALAWVVGMPAMTEAGAWHLTYTNNIGYWLRDGDWPNGLGHFWTLAVEEHFYLAWPLLVFGLPRRWLNGTAIGVAIVALACRIVWADAWTGHGYVLTPFALDSFAIGGLVALARRGAHAREAMQMLAFVGVALVAVTVWFRDDVNYAALETGMACLSAALVAWAWDHPQAVGLSWPPLVWVGTISYGVYVWHQAALAMLTHHGVLAIGYGWTLLGVELALGIGGAALTWYGFERPLNRLKDRAPRGVPVQVTA